MTAATSFPIMTIIPSGCRLHLITDERHVPHLLPGEWVVLDTDDIDEGEIYLVRQRQSGPMLWQVLRPPLIICARVPANPQKYPQNLKNRAIELNT